MYCKNHIDKTATSPCMYCGNLFCDECLIEINGKKYCKEHALIVLSSISHEEHSKSEENSSSKFNTHIIHQESINPKENISSQPNTELANSTSQVLTKTLDKESNHSSNNDHTSTNEFIGKNSINTLTKMIGKNSKHYLKIFRDIEDGKKCGPTALGLIWGYFMLYRKMYKEFFIFSALSLLVFLPVVGPIFVIILHIYLIIDIRKLYYESILNKLDKNNLTGIDISNDCSYNAILNKIGGTKYTWVIVSIVLNIVLVALIYIFFFSSLLFILLNSSSSTPELENYISEDTFSQNENEQNNILNDDNSFNDNFIAMDFFGKSVGDIISLLGTDYTIPKDFFEGSKGLYYDDIPIVFCFDGFATPIENNIVTSMFVYSGGWITDKLQVGMTFNEIGQTKNITLNPESNTMTGGYSAQIYISNAHRIIFFADSPNGPTTEALLTCD